MQFSLRQISDKSLFVAKELFVFVLMIIAGILLVGFFGGFVGFLLGLAMARSITKHDPLDKGHAQAYVGLGLIFLGAALGALLGLTLGIILFIMRIGNRKLSAQNTVLTS